MIKILQVNAGSKDYGGVSSFLFNVYKSIDKNKFQFDFLSPNITTYESKRKEITEMGGNIFELNVDLKNKKNTIKFMKKLYLILKNNNYDIVHINSGLVIFNYEVCLVAKKAKVKKIIVHSHNYIEPKNILKKIIYGLIKKRFDWICDERLSCSSLAAKTLFSNKVNKEHNYTIINNGIELEKFKFNENIRKKIRKKLNINNSIVFGNIGRLSDQKNQDFLIDVFKIVLNYNNNCKLLIIGDGPNKYKLIEKIKNDNLEDNIILLGYIENINEILNALDFFVFPSKFEGFGISLLEAEANGLKCYASKRVIPKEINIANKIKFIELGNTERWAKEILDNLEQNYSREYDNRLNIYSIENTVKEIEKIYMK